MFSAVRVAGRRLHQAARAGQTVERTARRVVVHALDLVDFVPAGPDGLARARVIVRCGKGTYVRTLASGLGKALGVPAHLGALRRTRSGPFTLANATALDEVERLGREAPLELRSRLVGPADALAAFPALLVEPGEVLALAQGKVLPREASGPLCRALDGSGALVAVVAPVALPASGEPPQGAGPARGVRPVRVFVQPAGIPAPGPAKR